VAKSLFIRFKDVADITLFDVIPIWFFGAAVGVAVDDTSAFAVLTFGLRVGHLIMPLCDRVPNIYFLAMEHQYQNGIIL